ncbi:MAG: nucleotidyltransferase domain-containing protein [Eubacterium sp.]|nr:nucleotidyltransferase domain-containing protein [Eubacterium sp.]
MAGTENKEINELKDCLVKKLSPLKIYLFGSFAEGKQSNTSDYDFYIIVNDRAGHNVNDLTTEAYKSVRRVKRRPVDIIVNTQSHFDERKDIPSIEYDVNHKGIIIYE